MTTFIFQAVQDVLSSYEHTSEVATCTSTEPAENTDSTEEVFNFLPHLTLNYFEVHKKWIIHVHYTNNAYMHNDILENVIFQPYIHGRGRVI